MRIKTSQLKIGTELYQYSSKILAYKIIAINKLTTSDHKQFFYILECTSCNDHKPCQIAIKFDDSGNLEYSHMVNQYEIDDEYDEDNEHCKNSQYYWHRNKDYYWFLTRKEARIFVHNKNISYHNQNIENAKKTIEYNERCIKEEVDKINALEESN